MDLYSYREKTVEVLTKDGDTLSGRVQYFIPSIDNNDEGDYIVVRSGEFLIEIDDFEIQSIKEVV